MTTPDYHSLIQRLFPREDGEPPLKYRKGICAGVGSGVIDVSLSGVVIPDVPIHGTASMSDEVHLLTDALGRMLAIGECGGGGGSPGDLVCELCDLEDLGNVSSSTSPGDMLYKDGTGLWVPVGGTPSTGDVPTKQGDGSVDWAAPGASGITGPVVDRVETSETTTSTSPTNLTTAGPAVTITIAASGILVVTITSFARNTTNNQRALMTFELSGANTFTAGLRNLSSGAAGDQDLTASACFVLTGLNAGSTTVTAKYYVGGGTGQFAAREVSAWSP